MDEPLWRYGAQHLAAAIREKRVSSREVVEAHLDRIEAVNSKVNAVTVVLGEDALRAANQADAKIVAGDALGPLHGVPFTVKENFDLVGSATTHGIVALKDSLPERDAHVVAQLKQAGAIPIGRTNLPDFGLRWHTDSSLYGATLNPWDPSRTPGGSSGGEAVAIATGMSPLGVGGDMGGSLRYPSQCCGVTAIKPTLGRVSRILTAIFPDPPMLYEQVASTAGPMARHIKDIRLALEIMSRRDPEDPSWTPAPWLGADITRPIRVALCIDPSGEGGSPAVAAGVRKAAEVLAGAGYDVEAADPPAIEEAISVLEKIANMETKDYLPSMREMISEESEMFLDGIVAETVPDRSTYAKAIAARYRIAQAWARFMESYPLILAPVSALEPFEIGYDVSGHDALRRLVRAFGLTEICNLLGLPSVAAPVEVTDGQPQGVQIIGQRFHEHLCLDAAEAIERVQGVFTPIEPCSLRVDHDRT